MEIVETGFEGLKVIKPQVFGDNRGFFVETYNEKRYRDDNFFFLLVRFLSCLA